MSEGFYNIFQYVSRYEVSQICFLRWDFIVKKNSLSFIPFEENSTTVAILPDWTVWVITCLR